MGSAAVQRCAWRTSIAGGSSFATGSGGRARRTVRQTVPAVSRAHRLADASSPSLRIRDHTQAIRR